MTTRVIDPIQRTNRSIRGILIGIAAMGVCLCSVVRADVTNAIWEAKISGTFKIQEFTQDLKPRIRQAKFKQDFFKLFDDIDVDKVKANNTVAFNIDMAQGRTNFYLTVYNLPAKINVIRLTTNEVTNIISDGKKFTFTTKADLPRGGIGLGDNTNSSPRTTSGVIVFAGRGKMIDGVPARVKANWSGYIVDLRPTDLGGSTGLVIGAKITTSGAPLRIVPSN